MAQKRIKKMECPNCGTSLTEKHNFCYHCGQENHTHKLPFKHFVTELLEGFFHFDTKLLATLKDLFIPGRMTVNFNQNKRARYVPPVRLYIFVSFIFFMLLSLSTSIKNEDEGEEESTDIILNDEGIDPDSLDGDGIYIKLDSDTTGDYLLPAIHSSIHPKKLVDRYIDVHYEKTNWFNKRIYRNIVLLNTGHITSEEASHKAFKGISFSMFLLMPIFALYLLLLYRKKNFFYSEHLIFSLNYHSLVFLLFSLWTLIGLLNISVGWVVLPVCLVYFYLSLRAFYQQGWLKTLTKSFALAIFYFFSIFIIVITSMLFMIVVK